jgi:hypothetical protein
MKVGLEVTPYAVNRMTSWWQPRKRKLGKEE